ncbi:non-ribosomal peptide synthetase, partial [Streptomyces sp. 6N223]|uniref:non-ribosomal peptide synthetase n=1 Tax=Streptomyces sp. 6N223 TaxID=3457412 RepID=UPI003FD55BF5
MGPKTPMSPKSPTTITFDEIEALAASPLSFHELCERYPRTQPLRVYQERDRCTELPPDELQRRVAALSGRLQRECEPQQKVMLLLPRIEDYVVGLLACFHANVVAVPTVVDAAAHSDANAETIATVRADSEASCLLADEETRAWLTEAWEAWEATAGARFLTPSGDDDAALPPREAARDDLAIMMYTSGSTSRPKGVMISHRTLMFQAAVGAVLWEIEPDSTVVSWLALTHNFGLPLALLSPLLVGASTVLMAPEVFVQYPEHWFELIDRHGGTHAGAPTSPLEHCVNAIDPAEVAHLSLAGVRSIFCAGEPIREQTVRSFTERFAALGLRPDAVRPHYGLTEIGCMATESSDASLTVLEADAASLALGRVVPARPGQRSRSLVRNGRVRGPLTIEIVDPRTAERCAPDEVGEIWFRSTATCEGYYRQPEESARAFGATIATTGESGFFRTGDLGFIRDDHLYLVGRVKELLIVNGMKYDPPDLETTLRRQIPELTLPTAVFAVGGGEEAERIVLVQELPEERDDAGYRRLVRRVRGVISDYYGVSLHDIVLAPPGSIPRSGIGKVRRNDCRRRYEAGELAAWFRARAEARASAQAPTEASAAHEGEVRRRLAREVIAPALEVAPEQVLEVSSLGELGTTSMQYIGMAKRIERAFGVPFAPAKLFKYNRLAELTAYLAKAAEESPPAHPLGAPPRPSLGGSAP